MVSLAGRLHCVYMLGVSQLCHAFPLAVAFHHGPGLSSAIRGSCGAQAAMGWMRSGSITCLLTCIFACIHLEQVKEFESLFSRPLPACACKITELY